MSAIVNVDHHGGAIGDHKEFPHIFAASNWAMSTGHMAVGESAHVDDGEEEFVIVRVR